MSKRNYYLKEFPWNEWKLFREKIIDDVKYTHYRTGKCRSLTKDHWVSFLNKDTWTSVLIVQRRREWMQEYG